MEKDELELKGELELIVRINGKEFKSTGKLEHFQLIRQLYGKSTMLDSLYEMYKKTVNNCVS